MPDRKRNTTEVITQHTNTNPRQSPIPEGKSEAEAGYHHQEEEGTSSNMFPSIGRKKISSTYGSPNTAEKQDGMQPASKPTGTRIVVHTIVTHQTAPPAPPAMPIHEIDALLEDEHHDAGA